MALDPITSSVLKNRNIRKAAFKGKRVLVRVDFNVPMKDGVVKDDSRIRAAIPTIKYILSKGATRVILVSHLGQPKGKEPAFSFAPVLPRVAEALEKNVTFASSIEGIASLAASAKIVLLENIRFEPGEERNDKILAKRLASIADIYVNDAFGTAHRAHASTAAIATYLPSYIGLLMEQEVKMLSCVLSPKRPFIVIVGFAKIADKIKMMKKLLDQADFVLVGGAVVFTLLYTQGARVGRSLVEPEQFKLAKQLLKKYTKKLILPVDAMCATSFEDPAPKLFPIDQIPDAYAGYDIGPASVALFQRHLTRAKTVFWNGPVGVFEHQPYDAATNAIAAHLSQCKATTIIGGGDTVSAVKKSGHAQKMSHLSTGGGAALEFIEGTLPALRAIHASKRSKN